MRALGGDQSRNGAPCPLWSLARGPHCSGVLLAPAESQAKDRCSLQITWFPQMPSHAHVHTPADAARNLNRGAHG